MNLFEKTVLKIMKNKHEFHEQSDLTSLKNLFHICQIRFFLNRYFEVFNAKMFHYA